MVTMYDVVIIGSGVSGTASARELSRYEGKICVVEKEEDVCCGTSKANSAIIHAGYDAQEGSLMAKLNVRGNELMGKLSEDLDILFERIGSLVVLSLIHISCCAGVTPESHENALKAMEACQIKVMR